MNHFSKLISARRKELKLTQKDLAEKLNVSDKTISKYETGRSYPEITLLKTLAKVLEIDVTELLDVEDMKEKETDFGEEDSYDIDVINNFKSKILTTIGLIVTGTILFFLTSIIDDRNIRILVLAAVFILGVFSLVFFISSNIRFRSFYMNKFYTKEYDDVFSKYTSITIVFYTLPFILISLLVHSVNIMNIAGIVSLLSLLIVFICIFTITKIAKISNFKIKKDKINKVLGVIAIIIFLTIVINLLPFQFILFIYLLIFIIIHRKVYINE